MIDKTVEKSIKKQVEKNFAEQTKFLTKLVKAKSPNDHTPQDSKADDPIEHEVAELIHGELTTHGFLPKRMGMNKKRRHILLAWGNKRASNSLMLNGHMDTIPPDVSDVISPYSGSVRGGKLYGLGALDMKGSLSAYVYAVRAIKEAGIKITGKLYLAFVVDEESGACSRYGTQYLLEQGIVPKNCIIGEHGSDVIRIGQRGGYRFKLTTKGEPVHTGMSAWERKEKGRNAIVDMSIAIKALQGLEVPHKSSKVFVGRKPVFTFPTKISGGTALNVVPEKCEAYGDVRLMPGNSDNQVKMLIVERLQKLNIDYKITDLMFVPAVEVDARENVVEVLSEQAEAVLGTKPAQRGAGPGTDGWMLTKRGVPTIYGFGPDGSEVHGRGEWVNLESLKKVTEVYARVIVEMLG